MDYSDLQQRVRNANRLDIGWWRGSENCQQLNLSQYQRVIEVSREDQVATIQTGINLEDLEDDLGFEGEIGIQHPTYVHGYDLTVPHMLHSLADLIATDFPNPFGTVNGTWRDWILGMKIILADGTIVQSGSKVVKSVSGFDLHKLMIGSRYTLGIPIEVTLRLLPFQRLDFRHDYLERISSSISAQPTAEMKPLMRRTKQLFDPTNKLNPGEFGFM